MNRFHLRLKKKLYIVNTLLSNQFMVSFEEIEAFYFLAATIFKRIQLASMIHTQLLSISVTIPASCLRLVT